MIRAEVESAGYNYKQLAKMVLCCSFDMLIRVFIFTLPGTCQSPYIEGSGTCDRGRGGGGGGGGGWTDNMVFSVYFNRGTSTINMS